MSRLERLRIPREKNRRDKPNTAEAGHGLLRLRSQSLSPEQRDARQPLPSRVRTFRFPPLTRWRRPCAEGAECGCRKPGRYLRGSFGRRPGSSGLRLVRCCSREAQSATAEEGGARSCLSSAPYVRLPELGAGRRVARLRTARDSRGPELRRRPESSPGGREAPGWHPSLRPRSERLAGPRVAKDGSSLI